MKLSRNHQHKLNLRNADSIAFAPQKTLGTGLQCSVFLVKDKDLLVSTNSCRVDYLFRSEKIYDTKYDIGDKSIQCGRKVWLEFSIDLYISKVVLTDRLLQILDALEISRNFRRGKDDRQCLHISRLFS
jgi:hypothetical protein